MAIAGDRCGPTRLGRRRHVRRLVTGANIAAWSVRLVQHAAVDAGAAQRGGMSVAITRTGDREAHASPTAPSALAAPGPVVVSATPSRPVARA